MQSSARSLCGNRFNCRSGSLGGKRRGQTNQGFFSVALEALLNIWHRQPKIESQRIFQPRLFGHFAFLDVCLLFFIFVFCFFVFLFMF